MKKLLALTLWLSLTTAITPAHADPVSGLIGLVSWVGSLGVVGQFVLGAAIKIGTSLYDRAKAKKEQTQAAGVQGSMRVGGDNPLSFIVGTYATSGSLEYVGTWGKDGSTPNAYHTQVISLSDLPVSGLSNIIWISGKQCTIDWNATPTAQGYPVIEYRDGGKDYLWVKFHDGTQTVTDNFLFSQFATGDRPWKADMIGNGVAYAIVTARLNRNLFTSAPSIKFIVQGIKLYDVRKDSSGGGSGAHRWNDPSTWEFSENPKVIQYNILRGISYQNEWFYGGQNLAAFQLPASNWMAAMNECDRQIALAEGGTETQFRAGAEILTNYQPIEAIKELDKTCGGRTAELGGIYKTICGAPGLPVYSFTDADIVITQSQEQDPFPGLESTINGISATYPEPAEAWNNKDAPARYNADYEASDANNRLLSELEYPYAPYGLQVQRLMSAALEEARRFRKHTATMPPEAFLIEPLDVISYTSPRNGYSTKRFLMGGMDDLPNVNQAVAFSEIDPADYGWTPSQQLPTSTGVTGPIVVPIQPMTGWTVEPSHISDAAGTQRRPAILVKCAPELEDVARVHVKVRLKATQAIVFDSDQNAYPKPNTNGTYQWLLSGTWCLPLTTFQVSGEYVPFSTRQTEPSDWIDVTTENILISSDDIFDNAIIQTKIADGAVIAAKIRDEGVTALKLADGAVTTTKIAVQAVTEQLLANSAVTADKMADAAVTSSKLRDSIITETKFAAGLKPVKVLSSPPVNGQGSDGDTATYGGALYTYSNGQWNSPSFSLPDGSVTANKLADAAVTAQKLASFAVTNDKIAVGAVYGDVIAAKAITARMLTLVDWENQVPDNKLQDPKSWGSDGGVLNPNSTRGFDSQGELNWTYTGGTGYKTALLSQFFPVVPDQQYRCGFQFIRTSGTKVGIWARLDWYDAQGNNLNTFGTILDATAGNTISGLQKFGADVQAPSNAAAARYVVYVWRDNTDGNFACGAPSVLRKAGANLIVDGAIIANKLAVNSVTAASVQAGAIGVDQLAAGAVVASKLAAGAITTDKLAVGSGGNIFKNSAFEMDGLYWGREYQDGNNWTVGIRTDNYAAGKRVYEIRKSTAWGGGQVYGIRQYNGYGTPLTYAAEAGKYYELSCYYYGHRCRQIELWICFLDTNDAVIQYLSVPFDANINGNPAQQLSNYRRAWAKFLAPAGTVRCFPFFRHGDTANVSGYNDSYLWLKNLYFGEANANQTQPTPWSEEGNTFIQGGEIVARSVTADRIVAGALTAYEIAAGTITGDKVAAGTITGVNIQGSTITGDKIAANTISAAQMAADAITAKSLLLTDFSNMSDNGYGNGNLGGWNVEWYRNYYIDNNLGWITQHDGGAVYMRQAVPIMEGDWFFADVYVYNQAGARAVNYIAWLDVNGNWLSASHCGYTDAKNQWVRLQGRVQAPAGARFCRQQLQRESANTNENTFWGRPVMRRASGAELIVDGSITAGKMSVNSLDAISANLGNVNISQAYIGTLTVGTGNIQGGAVSDVFFGVGGNGISGTLVSIGVNNPYGAAVIIQAAAQPSSAGGNALVTLAIQRNGGTIRNLPIVTGNTPSNQLFSGSYFLVDAPGAGSFTYSLVVASVSGISTITIPTLIATVLKR
ncbi:phage tail protein [Oryzifoliimicrobium ureilyticus]|uniref:phage tail protein n=1 Tax=Oryzifoliimicrobium ureilyticus TaxID=3113724 RepID=UPI0030760B42